MIQETKFSVSLLDIEESLGNIPNNDRCTINYPTGNFFYDPWKLKEEYLGTIWQKIYDSLDVPNKGEARIITLDKGTNYYSHADIDDRWHLNIKGDQAYLIDLDNQQLHLVLTDGKWYTMDAGRIHVGANFGCILRTQIVIRHLLTRNNLHDKIKLKITFKSDRDPILTRHKFDINLCPWLNQANKLGNLNNFFYNGSNQVEFETKKDMFQTVVNLLDDDFVLETI